MFEVAPTVLFTVPRYLQKFAAQILVGIGNSSSTQARGLCAGDAAGAPDTCARLWDGVEQRHRGGSLSACSRARVPADPEQTRLRPTGTRRLRRGARSPRETMALWHMYGVNVVEIYGQTETAGGIIAGQRGPFSGARRCRHSAVRLERAPVGRRRSSGAQADIFEGYWRNDEATRSGRSATTAGCTPATSANGATAHCGWSTARATSSSPRAARRCRPPSSKTRCARRRTSAEVAVFGHGRKYLIGPRRDRLRYGGRLGPRGRTSLTPASRVSRKIRQVERLIESEIDKANAQLARVEQIKALPHFAKDARSRSRKVSRSRRPARSSAR